MDENYPIEAASEALERESAAALNGRKGSKYLYGLKNNAAFASSAIVRFDRLTRQYHLHKEIGDDESELILRVVGILTDRDLPPVTSLPYRAVKYVRQSVTLTGFGGATFDDALEGIVAVQAKLSKSMGQDQLLPWTPGKYDDSSTISASCRYFTSNQGHADDSVPIDATIDPYRLMAAVDKNKFKYTKDNVVGYYKRSVIENERGLKNRYEDLDPKIFGIGDIVEAHLAFKAFLPPEKSRDSQKRMFKLGIVLRSLVLIEDKFTEEAKLTSFRAHLQLHSSKNIRKRNAEYSEDEDDDVVRTSKRLNAMEINT